MRNLRPLERILEGLIALLLLLGLGAAAASANCDVVYWTADRPSVSDPLPGPWTVRIDGGPPEPFSAFKVVDSGPPTAVFEATLPRRLDPSEEYSIVIEDALGNLATAPMDVSWRDCADFTGDGVVGGPDFGVFLKLFWQAP